MDLKTISVTGIILLEAMALYKGIDGTALGIAFASIAAICGYGIGYERAKKRAIEVEKTLFKIVKS